MNLFIQIPCYNEEDTLAMVLADLPREIPGIDRIYTIILDDGSTDRTVNVAKESGVDYILSNPVNIGLAQTFFRGIDACLQAGADIIVNTDADNQYQGKDIARLVAPILDGSADIVVGCRDIRNHKEFSRTKKYLQAGGGFVVRNLSGVPVKDVTSGFRAYRKNAAMRLAVMSNFSYTLETLIQAGKNGLAVISVPVGVNPQTRPSRLFRSNSHFILQQIKTIFSAYLFYCPMRFFGALAVLFGAVSVVCMVRLSYYLLWVDPEFVKFKTGTGFLCLFALILTVICIVSGLFGSVLTGLRLLLEDLRYRIRSDSDAPRLWKKN